MQTLIGLVFVLLVVAAMVEDARRYRIPNWMSLALIAAFGARVLVEPGLPVAAHVIAAALVFVAFLLCYLGGWFGAGDVKMLAAVSLWAGPTQQVLLLGVMGLTGLVLGVLVLLARRTAATGARWPKPIGRWAEQGACPYGIAIGLGALAVAFRSWL